MCIRDRYNPTAPLLEADMRDDFLMKNYDFYVLSIGWRDFFRGEENDRKPCDIVLIVRGDDFELTDDVPFEDTPDDETVEGGLTRAEMERGVLSVIHSDIEELFEEKDEEWANKNKGWVKENGAEWVKIFTIDEARKFIDQRHPPMWKWRNLIKCALDQFSSFSNLMDWHHCRTDPDPKGHCHFCAYIKQARRRK